MRRRVRAKTLCGISVSSTWGIVELLADQWRLADGGGRSRQVHKSRPNNAVRLSRATQRMNRSSGMLVLLVLRRRLTEVTSSHAVNELNRRTRTTGCSDCAEPVKSRRRMAHVLGPEDGMCDAQSSTWALRSAVREQLLSRARRRPRARPLLLARGAAAPHPPRARGRARAPPARARAPRAARVPVGVRGAQRGRRALVHGTRARPRAKRPSTPVPSCS